MTLHVAYKFVRPLAPRTNSSTSVAVGKKVAPKGSADTKHPTLASI